MDRSVAEVFDRWLGPSQAGFREACPSKAGVSACGPRLGTGRAPSVRAAMNEIRAREPKDYEAWERNMAVLYRVAEGDLVIAAAESAGHEGELVQRGDQIAVLLSGPEGEPAGEVSIRYQSPDLDPAGVGEPYTWALGGEVPERLAAAITELAPAWVRVIEVRHGRVVMRRRAQRKYPPRAWGRRLPDLQTPRWPGGERP